VKKVLERKNIASHKPLPQNIPRGRNLIFSRCENLMKTCFRPLEHFWPSQWFYLLIRQNYFILPIWTLRSFKWYTWFFHPRYFTWKDKRKFWVSMKNPHRQQRSFLV